MITFIIVLLVLIIGIQYSDVLITVLMYGVLFGVITAITLLTVGFILMLTGVIA